MKTNFCLTHSRIQKQLRLGLSYCLSLVSVLAISAEVMATPLPEKVALSVDAEAIAETEAIRLRPAYSLNLTEGAGHNGFASFGSFFPLFQTPEKNVTFLEGRVNVDTDGDFGGGLQVGYRTLLNNSTILGAYAGVDVRDTGHRTFTQVGVGSELLGENWDVTLNANIPLGNARQVVDTDIQLATPQFAGNQLLIDELQIDQVQAALTTVSLDGGLELFDFGGGSGLWGRGGVYYLGGEASEDSLGVRASLDYRPKNNLRFGVGLQNDGIFDTNVTFSVNALLGSSSQRSSDAAARPTEENSRSQLWARAAEPIARTNTVLVEHRTDVEILQADVAVINPETGNAFVFRHVDPDAAPSKLLPAETLQAASEGTVEDPLSTVAQAANIADANADNIIFVQEGNVGGGFTLPDGVQVRSAGPVQQLATQFGDITLPGSGSGNLPTVTGTVTVGNNALVSGLNIDPSASALEEALAPAEVIAAEVTAAEATEAQEVANGIVARGENITLEDNVIANVNQGIDLPDIDGTVSIVRNQISNTLSDGIFFGNIEGEDNATVTVANNTLDTVGGEGIEFGLIQGNAIANITVASNQITDAQVDSIFFDDIQQDAIATIVVEGNIINAENVEIGRAHV